MGAKWWDLNSQPYLTRNVRFCSKLWTTNHNFSCTLFFVNFSEFAVMLWLLNIPEKYKPFLYFSHAMYCCCSSVCVWVCVCMEGKITILFWQVEASYRSVFGTEVVHTHSCCDFISQSCGSGAIHKNHDQLPGWLDNCMNVQVFLIKWTVSVCTRVIPRHHGFRWFWWALSSLSAFRRLFAGALGWSLSESQ